MTAATLTRPDEDEGTGDHFEDIEFTLPAALVRLTEEEAYLAAILMDRSGLDLAELTWVDEQTETRCYRAYPFQWMWWRCQDEKQIDQGARSLGKSESIIAQAGAFPFNFIAQEFLIVTPEGSHADALTERMEARLLATRLMREMLARGGGRRGITHHPFQATFANGARIMVRLPQTSGIGVKGMHPVVLHVDEAQDVSERTWKEIPEIVRKEVDGHQTRAHGVSRGVQDDFYKKTQPESEWTVHRLSKMHRPDLDPYRFELDGELLPFSTNDRDKALRYARKHGAKLHENWRDSQAREYTGGGRADPAFKRNVYGIHGEAMNRIFVLTRLMANVDTNEGSTYNTEEYHRYIIGAEAVAARAETRSGRRHDVNVADDDQVAAILELIPLSPAHTAKETGYTTFWCGMDVGIIGDPSEILVFAEYVPKAKERAANEAVGMAVPIEGVSRFKLLARIQMNNVAPKLQAHVVMHVINHYRPRAFSLDRTGNGIAILRTIQEIAGVSRVYVFEEADQAAVLDPEHQALARDAMTHIKGYNFGEKVVIDIDELIVEERKLTDPQQILDEAGIRQNVKDAGTDVLRKLVDSNRFLFPYDGLLIQQMNAATETVAHEPYDQYGRARKVYGRGDFHILDAARMFALGMDMQPIEAIQASIRAPKGPVLDRFGF